MSAIIPSAGIDILDSHYQWVRNRINAVTTRSPIDGGPHDVIAGVLNAQDWPPKNVKMDMFYMLIMGRVPIGKQGFSAANPIKFHLVQWTWIIKGSDLKQGQRAAYRGDRYRTMQQMIDELMYGCNPNYAERQSWTLDSNDEWVATSYSPAKLYFTWTPVEIHETMPKESGVAYGTGNVRLQDIPLSYTT